MALLGPKTLVPPLDITVVKDWAGMGALTDWLKAHEVFNWDLETPPLKGFWKSTIRLMQFGNREKQFNIDLLAFVNSPEELMDAQGDYGARLHNYPELHKLVQTLVPFLCSGKYLKVGVNLWYEYTRCYWNFGIRPWNFFDNAIVERVIRAGEIPLQTFDNFSMEAMMLRYYGVEIDKTLQTSFDVGNEISDDQHEYGALDVRFPSPLRSKQIALGHAAGLLKVFQLENDSVGAFGDMHVHGELLDIPVWAANTEEAIAKLTDAIKRLDTHFLPIVGSKNLIVTDEDVEKARQAWKVYNEVSSEELELHAQRKAAKKNNDLSLWTELDQKMSALEAARKLKKEELKKVASELGKTQTKINKLAEKCEGEALINYDSESQIHDILLEYFPKFKRLKSTNDDDIKQYEGDHLIDALRDYREWSKRVKTYGYTFITEWLTHPCAEEGWISPYTHRLHSMYNQLNAETGRTSSDNPNGQNIPKDKKVRKCFIAGPGMVYVICDMSGAELRILAELANAKTWIDCFARKEDLHSVCTEIFYPVEWKDYAFTGQLLPKEPEKGPYYCDYFKLHTEETVKENPLCKIGTPMRRKCKCPKHNELRNGTKPVNFGLPYGSVPSTIAKKENLPLEQVARSFALHEKNFPDIWEYLAKSGMRAKVNNKATDMFGRRRLLPAPTQERARAKCIKDYAKDLLYPVDVQKKNIQAFIDKNGRKPTKEERFWLTHKEPTQKLINKAFIAINQGIERQGKNHEMQGTNASIIKKAMGCGFSPKGMPYLFHTLPLLKARLIKMVHDELVIECPPENAQLVARTVGKAFREAAIEAGMTKVIMEFDYNVSKEWMKD